MVCVGDGVCDCVGIGSIEMSCIDGIARIPGLSVERANLSLHNTILHQLVTSKEAASLSTKLSNVESLGKTSGSAKVGIVCASVRLESDITAALIGSIDGGASGRSAVEAVHCERGSG